MFKNVWVFCAASLILIGCGTGYNASSGGNGGGGGGGATYASQAQASIRAQHLADTTFRLSCFQAISSTRYTVRLAGMHYFSPDW